MADALGDRVVRQVYLVTYSQADLVEFPDKMSFANAINQSFQAVTNAVILHWVCAEEAHQDGGTHYHMMALKLDKCHRWLAVRDHIQAEYGINVHFSNRHCNYYSAWQYVCKEDEEPLQSDPHPDLADPPKTQAASQAVASQGGPMILVASRKRKREDRISNYDFSKLIRDKKLKTRTQVLAFAAMQEREGKSDVAEFIFSRSRKVLEELIQTSLDMETAEADVERSRLARIAILERAAEGNCVEGCHQQAWYAQAEDILRRNLIPKASFAGAIYTLLQEGRGKYRNILLIGPANCGKTFLLSPLTDIFRAFNNPASTTFAWVGVEDAEIILLNDFRWTPQIISWSDFLILLEGDTVHLPPPKTHFSRDICLSSDVPILATSSHQIVYVKGKDIDQRETEMMTIRWRMFPLNVQIPRGEQRELPPCPHCFAKFILDNK